MKKGRAGERAALTTEFFRLKAEATK